MNARCAKRLELAKQIARDRGGECLSNVYVGAKAHLSWRCGESHPWTASLDNVKNGGTWCPKCADLATGDKVRKWSLADMQAHAASKGGRCLSTEYTSVWQKLTWQCAEEHPPWTADFHSMQCRDSWCPTCSGRIRRTLADAQRLAAENGGECLSTEFVNTHSHLEWRCAERHVWEATYHSVQDAGSWCPTCGKTTESMCFEIITALFRGRQFVKTRGLPWLRTDKGEQKLELDMWNEELRLALEYNGRQHYEVVEKWHPDGDDDLIHQQRNDEIKLEACELEGVCLLVVPYHIHKGHRPKRRRVTLARFIHAAIEELGYPPGTHLNLDELLAALDIAE